jgi:hypothetical protein
MILQFLHLCYNVSDKYGCIQEGEGKIVLNLHHVLGKVAMVSGFG